MLWNIYMYIYMFEFLRWILQKAPRIPGLRVEHGSNECNARNCGFCLLAIPMLCWFTASPKHSSLVVKRLPIDPNNSPACFVPKWPNLYIHVNYVYNIYIYIYTCACVCVCACIGRWKDMNAHWNLQNERNMKGKWMEMNTYERNMKGRWKEMTAKWR